MTLTEQFATMIAMTAVGGWIGCALTIYQRFFHPKKRRQVFLLLTDTLFWAVQGLVVFLVLLYVNQGEVRFYIFLALALGFSAYKALFETIFKKGLEGVIRSVLFVMRLIRQAIAFSFIYPALVLLKLLYRLGKMIGRFLLALLLVLLKLIYVPLRWGFKRLLPTEWILKIKAFGRAFKAFFARGWIKRK
ncbi:spore cortex biosynthesis protein YabQ [Caenibacillus caldisaponilyticus]|uniref:spore cortex biosynthesis protein YabQ n=1 Tax=Caenibacillus caldisaponilyticus TaxID=1674942 RepID=UPI000988360A|nr:spore cortex biosynthesis protein YabQ [Caenibacillus caldisaponilyticus]